MSATQEQKWFKIGEVARFVDVSVETIRMYEREGLLIPERKDTGQRLFNQADIHWVGCIRHLIKEEGLNIEGIRRLLSLIPCWNIKPCTAAERRDCPAYLRSTKPCWMIKPQLSRVCQDEDCRRCQVYQNAMRCENLKSLLRQYTTNVQEPIDTPNSR